ncbi:PrpF domain-containing protein [Streptomyces iranensis]|uniref:2-methylaconitate cis-trans-isomerase PrpF n=1 Tax=Streptomyces iranensis TaxID=576784 RepID=A0A061A7S1_9ACTN|nr:PrpF domain-containing protein [Streptomyces iranensis]MBP2066151.1 2-methylaconitate cis-trans-isomerase PrpF [Streptomyces iranensis]CDR13201.1 PrpF protein [Streptomyces iranensis]
MTGIECAIVRGGTSKGIFIERHLLPAPGRERDDVVLDVFGSPDVRQIDGLGGADKLTSKLAVIGPPTRPDCDVDYLFGQVGTALATVDWTSNCGNISAGAAAYAVHRGYAKPAGGAATVAIHQVNTGRRLLTTVPVTEDGRPAWQGDFAIGGVPGTGARIDLDFGDFGGGIMKRGVLPTGNAVDTIDVPGIGRLDMSVVDAANLCVFVRATDVGVDPRTGVDTLQADSALIDRLEAVRARVSREIGFLSGPGVEEELRSRVNPLAFVIAPPTDYDALNGVRVHAAAHDLVSRSMARRAFSKAHPATGSIGTAVASGIPGTIAHESYRGYPADGAPYSVRIGHPGGTLDVTVERENDPSGTPLLRSAVIGRTARVIMEGTVFLK